MRVGTVFSLYAVSPHRVLPGRLGDAGAARLLACGLAAKARFTLTRPNDRGSGVLDRVVRQSSAIRDLGAMADPLRRKSLRLQIGLETAFGMEHRPAQVEQIEMVAHGDSAFYRRHSDTCPGDEYALGGRRRMTMACHFHRQPRLFAGDVCENSNWAVSSPS